MKKIILLIVPLFLISCQIQEPNDNNKQELSKEKKEFDKYLKLFENKELPIVVDSLYILREMEQTHVNKIDTQFIKYIKIKELTEKCGQYSQYIIYPNIFLKINDKYGLLYYATLNKLCSFEAYYNRFFLGIYDYEGELLGFDEIGSRQDMWDNTKLIYTYIDNEFNMYKTFIEIKEDIEDGVFEITKKYDTLQIKSNGIIE